MKLHYTPAFLRAFGELPREIQHQIAKQLVFLETNPHHPSLRTHRRRGEKDVWQARITRNYRLYFAMEGDTIVLLTVSAHEK